MNQIYLKHKELKEKGYENHAKHLCQFGLIERKNIKRKKTLKNKKELQEIVGIVFENPTNHIKEMWYGMV